MIEGKSKDWKMQVVDEIDSFIQRIDPVGKEAWDLLLEDEGQVNLSWDAMRPFFPTNKLKPGDELTAIELGRLFGHWRSLWIALLVSNMLSERLAESHRKVVEARDRIDVILSKHLPDAMNGIQTSMVHLMAVTNDPALLDAIRENDKAFDALSKSVREFVYSQPHDQREAFMTGYGQALSAQTVDENGSAKMPDKLAQLLVFARPFAIRAKLVASDFQERIDQLAGSRITGHPESFAKRLQRRRASLRGKGRPAKKAGQDTGSTKKKSDNL
jgi:hypothetical protein